MFRGQNREWQWESRMEGVHAGGDQKGGNFNHLTFRQVEMVQDRGVKRKPIGKPSDL